MKKLSLNKWQQAVLTLLQKRKPEAGNDCITVDYNQLAAEIKEAYWGWGRYARPRHMQRNLHSLATLGLITIENDTDESARVTLQTPKSGSGGR